MLLLARSLKVSPQTEGIQRNVVLYCTKPVLFVSKQCTKRVMLVVMSDQNVIVQELWPSWAVRPNEPYGFRGRKAVLNHASALNE